MVKKILIKSARKLIQNKKEIEDKLNVKILIRGTNVSISGKAIDEHFAERVILALDYKFLIEEALLLKDETFDFKILHIKDHTHRHDLNIIKGRIIGTKGKTLGTLRELTVCEVAVKENTVAIIGPVERIHEAEEAIIALIKGSKQGNVYAHLESLNRGRRIRRND